MLIDHARRYVDVHKPIQANEKITMKSLLRDSTTS